MKFSIIVPVYNIEKYIKKCLESVLSQTYTDYELILVDDGSTDSSGTICDRLAGKYQCIRVIHQENKGQAQARNVGIQAAKGEYILFLDGDDYWYGKDNLKKLTKKLNESREIPDVIAYGGVSAYLDGAKTVFNKNHVNNWKENKTGYRPEEFLKVHMKENPAFYWYPWLYAFKRALFVDNNLFFPCGRKYEDLYLIWRVLLKAGRICVIPDTFYVYRRHREASTTHTVTYKYLMDFLWVVEQNIDDLKRMEMEPELKQGLLDSFSKNYFLCCSMSAFLKGKEKKKMVAGLKKHKELMKYAHGRMYKAGRTVAKTMGFSNLLRMQRLRIRLKGYGKQ